MKKSILFLFILISGFVNAQKTSIIWNTYNAFPHNGKNRPDHRGENDEYVYFQTNGFKKFFNNCHYVAINKKNASIMNYIGLNGKENKDYKKYEGFSIEKFIPTDKIVYIIFSKDDEVKNNTRKVNYYIQTFTKDLKPISEFTKLYNYVIDYKKLKQANFDVICNVKTGNILLLEEMNGDKGNKISLKYKVLDTELKLISANQSEIPYLQIAEESTRNQRSSNYTLDEKNNVHIYTVAKDEKYNNIHVFGMIDEKSEIKYEFLSLEDKVLHSTTYEYKNGFLKIHSLYSNKIIDKSPINGIAYFEFDENYNLIKHTTNEFSKATITKMSTRIKESGVVVSGDDYIDNKFSIVKAFNEDNNESFICIKQISGFYENNYNNIYCIKLNDNKNIKWEKIIDRKAMHYYPKTKDIYILKTKTGYNVYYSDKVKPLAEKYKFLHYTNIDNNGKTTRVDHVVNPKGTKVKRYALPRFFEVYDNKIYLYSNIKKGAIGVISAED